MPGLFLVGTRLTADVLNSATFRPVCRVHQVVAQTGLVSASETVISFTTEDIDTEGWHDNVTNNSRITPNIAGNYEVAVTGVFAATTGQITSTYDAIYKNGALYSRSGNAKQDAASALNTGTPGFSDIVSLNGTTDYVQMAVGFSASANQATNVSASGQCLMTVKYLGPS